MVSEVAAFVSPNPLIARPKEGIDERLCNYGEYNKLLDERLNEGIVKSKTKYTRKRKCK